MKMSDHFYKRETCRLCSGNNIELALPLAPSALCDAYIPEARLNEVQQVFPLDIFVCRDCGYVLLPYVVAPEVIYRDYIYVSTSSMGLADHFGEYAALIMAKLSLSPGKLAVDIGSNDGTLLGAFKNKGMHVLGVEPAVEIARKATEDGITTLPVFFTVTVAEKIVREYGQASLITVNNLFANIDDLEGFTRGIAELLASDGVLVIESSYLADMIQNMVFDFIYHEHLSYFSVTPLHGFFKRFGLELFDVERVPTKGGSLRYYVQKTTASRQVSSSIEYFLKFEEESRLHSLETFRDFAARIDARKNGLVSLLHKLKQSGKTVAGFGGSATTTTLLYHFGIAEMLDYIVDDNPAKHNTFSPGYHIPVLPSSVLCEKMPDYTVVLAWRYFDPIITKNSLYTNRGGYFIKPLPELCIVPDSGNGL